MTAPSFATRSSNSPDEEPAVKIANEFTISAPVDRAWDVLTDLEQVIPLMPGARLVGRDGEDVLGQVKVKVGPVTSEFSGKVRFIERDAAAHRAVIDGKGKESRGTGNAAATVTAQLHDAGDHTRVTVDTDLKIVGKLAQFGGGMLQQVSEKLLGQFVDSLEEKLAGSAAPPVPDAVPAEPTPIDLLDLAGGDALKKSLLRYGARALAVFAVAALLFTMGRRRLARKARRHRP
jgi:carbon monoxide dehydrogenase subunit G